MSFCPNCGAEVADGASFCAQCGTPAAKPDASAANAQGSASANAEQASPAVQSEAVTTGSGAAAPSAETAASTDTTTAAAPAQPAGEPQAAPAASAASAPQAAPAPAPQPQPQAAPAPAPQASQVPPTQQVYAQGCVSAAWSDITKSKGWFGKIALMALINFIPILNWVISGYCMRWSRQLVFGKVEDMPKSLFCNRAFINGVFAFVIGLVIAVVLWICNTILGFIPFLGWIAIIVLSFFAVMFQYLCNMRAAVADSLGAGFQLGKIWNTFTRNLGSLFCAAVVPGLIIGIVTGIVVTIILSIGMAVIVGGSIFDIIDIIDTYAYYSSSRAGLYAAQILVQLIISMIPVAIIAWYVGGIGTSLSALLTFRSMGHWVSRYASDWASDPMVTATAHMYDVLETPQQSAGASAVAPNGQTGNQPPAQQ